MMDDFFTVIWIFRWHILIVAAAFSLVYAAFRPTVTGTYTEEDNDAVQ